MGPRVGSLGVWAQGKGKVEERGERREERVEEVMVVMLVEMTEEKKQREFAYFESEREAD